jgi:NAD(P)H-dependent FMN reductase
VAGEAAGCGASPAAVSRRQAGTRHDNAGASPGKIGTAVGQRSLRSALSFCNSPLMAAAEAYIQLTPGLITQVGEVTDKTTELFVRDFMEACKVFVARVLAVLPPERFSATGS